MNSCTLRPSAEARALATVCRCASFGPISATAIPFAPLEICGSATCALVDISALAIMSLILLSFAVDASCRWLWCDRSEPTLPDMGQYGPALKAGGKQGSGK